MSIKQQLDMINGQIAACVARYLRAPNSVQLIAVTKGQSVAAIKEAIAAGQLAFGENYLQEALAKMEQLKSWAIEWHYLGAIQSNKTKPIAEHFAWVHSVSSLKTAQRLSKQRPATLAPLNICLQVKLDQDIHKTGITVAELFELAPEIATLPGIRLRGLMTIPAKDSIEHAAQVFMQLKATYDKLQQRGCQLDTLSMGMSNDFEAAIAAGATQVRIGTALFGPRVKKE